MFFFLKPQWIISLCLKFNIFAPDEYPGPGCLRSLGGRRASISCGSLSILGGLYGRDRGPGGSGEGRENSCSCYCNGFQVEAHPMGEEEEDLVFLCVRAEMETEPGSRVVGGGSAIC